MTVREPGLGEVVVHDGGLPFGDAHGHGRGGGIGTSFGPHQSGAGILAGAEEGDITGRARTTLPPHAELERGGHRLAYNAQDLLGLVNEVDRLWHGQPRDFEREAVTRLFMWLTLPARLLDARRPAALARGSTLLRNVRFNGASVRDIFFRDQDFTEVDAIFLDVGSPVGHTGNGESYVVEVERKAQDRDGDYFRAMQRARKVSALFRRAFDVLLRPVVIYDDRDGQLGYPSFEDDLVVVPMSRLRALTEALPVSHPDEVPGRASDRTMVKLDLLCLLARANPDDPRASRVSPRGLVDAARRGGLDLHLPVMGHQNLDRAPPTLRRWFQASREDDKHLVSRRISRYLSELEEVGAVRGASSHPALTRSGGDVVLAYTHFLDHDRRAADGR